MIGDAQIQWDGRGHFFAAAAEAMRRILIDRARHRQSKRAGGEHHRVEWTENLPAMTKDGEDEEGRLLKLDQALGELEEYDGRKAELVKLRFYAGLSNKQAADALGISAATADRDWSFAKAWLQRAIDS